MYTNIAVCYISLNFCCNRALHTDRLQGTAPVWLNRPEKPPPNQHSRGGGGGAAPWPGPPTASPCEARGYRSAPSAARAGPGRAPPGEREGAPEGAPPCLQRGACPRSPPSRLRSTEAARPRPRPRPDPPLQVPRGLTAILRPPPAGPAAPSRSSARRRPPQVPLSARPQRFPPAEASPWGAGDVQQLLTGPVAAALGARLQRRLNGGGGARGEGKRTPPLAASQPPGCPPRAPETKRSASRSQAAPRATVAQKAPYRIHWDREGGEQSGSAARKFDGSPRFYSGGDAAAPYASQRAGERRAGQRLRRPHTAGSALSAWGQRRARSLAGVS